MTKFLIRHLIKDHDTPAEPQVRRRYGMLAGGMSICCNLLLFGAKLAVGWLSGSVAVTADAFNNLGDCSSCVVTLLGFRMAAKPADREHPFGHGRVEYVASFILAVLMLLAGFELGKSAVAAVLHPAAQETPWQLFLVLPGSMLLKLWMGIYNRYIGRLIDSDILRANMRDSFNDIAATAAVLGSALLRIIWPRLPWDGLAGLVVAGFILWGGVGIVRRTIGQLLGRAPDPALVEALRERLLTYDGVSGVHDLLVHDYGAGRCIASVHAEVPAESDVLAIHETIDRAEQELGAAFSLLLVIHMDPISARDPETLALRERVTALAREMEPDCTLHDFRVTKGTRHSNVLFDLVVPIAYTPRQREEIEAALAAAVAADDPRLEAHIRVESNFY
ncbi:MAG: cation diffusion facilitator family transporter [Oscillospiraceae bacterium]|jgi:cation diffusion facilitator family transporter|nr:cation diffusion facilitator family transporter [Oscillospiraceae bacterium]